MTVAISLPENGHPIEIAVTRGSLVESRHTVRAVVVNTEGQIIEQWGQADALVYPRSAVKPFQALPLVISGAADRYGLDARHIALAGASHNGEAEHVDLVRDWLVRAGLTSADLECGATEPIDVASARHLLLSGGVADPVYNNCSGKHCGFLTLAQHLNLPTKGYIAYDHPVQEAVRRAMAEIFGYSLDGRDWGTDGCGIPTYALPLKDCALAFARFADPSNLSKDVRTASMTVFEAMTANPYLVGGRNRFDTAVMECRPGEIMIKSGAEGVCAASILDKGLGIVTKVSDGARRASDVAMAAVLRFMGILNEADWRQLKVYAEPIVKNVAGHPVGRIHACKEHSS